MKLVPLSDRVVLKQMEAKKPPNPELYFQGRIKRNRSRRSCRCRTRSGLVDGKSGNESVCRR